MAGDLCVMEFKFVTGDNVKFLTNLHPQNYCIPCCKKKSVDDIKVKSKYENIHNQCLMNYSYDKKNLNENVDMKSRYIINYSSKIFKI